MEVIKYLNEKLQGSLSHLEALKDLTLEYGIKCSVKEGTALVVLNYDHINSPKTHPITIECRGLVLYMGKPEEFLIESRSFDRFFNQGDVITLDNLEGYTCMEKLDGSVVSVWFNRYGGWKYKTSGMIMPDRPILNGQGNWKDLIEGSLGGLLKQDPLDYPWLENYTLIFEVTSRLNRVVLDYLEDSATLLSIRNNHTGEYVSQDLCDDAAEKLSLNRPKTVDVSTIDDLKYLIEFSEELIEGYVVYDNSTGEPVVKVKGTEYTTIHHLKGEGVLGAHRAIMICLDGECEEVSLTCPPYADLLGDVEEDLNRILDELNELWSEYSYIDSSRVLHKAVGGSPYYRVIYQKFINPHRHFRDILKEVPKKKLKGYFNGVFK